MANITSPISILILGKSELSINLDGSVRARAIAPWLRKAWVGYRAASHRGRTKMRCLECGSEAVTERAERTAQGYRRFRCRACAKQFNERSGTL